MGAAQPFFAHQPTTRVHADRGFDRLCDANACSACSLAARPLCGAQELPVIHREANPLDVPEQCCGLSLPTLAQEDRHHEHRSRFLCTPPAGDQGFGHQSFVPASAVGRRGTVRSFTVSLLGSTPSTPE